MLRLSVRLELYIIKYIFAYWKFVKYNQNYQGEKLRHTAEWKPESKKPKIKNLLASNFFIYTPYKQEPI